VVMNMTVKF